MDGIVKLNTYNGCVQIPKKIANSIIKIIYNMSLKEFKETYTYDDSEILLSELRRKNIKFSFISVKA